MAKIELENCLFSLEQNNITSNLEEIKVRQGYGESEIHERVNRFLPASKYCQRNVLVNVMITRMSNRHLKIDNVLATCTRVIGSFTT